MSVARDRFSDESAFAARGALCRGGGSRRARRFHDARFAGACGLLLFAVAGCDHGIVLLAEPPGDGAIEDVSGCDPRPVDCLPFAARVWPVATDGGSTCIDSGGNSWPSTGAGAADWFDYGGCGSVKEYSVPACTWVRLHARGDSCDGCVLWHVHYRVEVPAGSSWVVAAERNPEPDVRGMQDDYCFASPSGRFRVRALDGFYLEVYGE